MQRIKVKGQLLRWARERSRIPLEQLIHRFPALPKWEAETRHPTWKQLEAYARVTHAPFGSFFLEQAPDERLSIPTLRMMGAEVAMTPSADLRDTIHLCQLRQDWYREHALASGCLALPFVGSMSARTPIDEAAAVVLTQLHADMVSLLATSTPIAAVAQFIGMIESIGILVMLGEAVPGSKDRRLDLSEFRGFALVDEVAPLIFLNAADSPPSQLFTLAHELAHVWLGTSQPGPGLPSPPAAEDIERWCDAVATALLHPEGARSAGSAKRAAAQRFGKSKKAVLQVSESFSSALVASTLEGHTLYAEAFKLLGIHRTSEFNALGRALKMAV